MSLAKDTCQMTLPNSNELATGTVKLVNDVYECEFEKRAYTDIANNQHVFDGGIYKLEGVGSSGGKMVVTVHTPGEQSIVARGNRRGKTVQIRQKGELWIVLNLE